MEKERDITKRFLAFDLGAESGRAVVGIMSGDRLKMTEIHRFATGSICINGHLYWNVLGFFEQLLVGLKEYVKRYGSEVDGIGVDTWGVDFGLLDEAGYLLGIPMTYRDRRNAETPDTIEKRIGKQRLYEFTGIQLLPFNSVNQLIAMQKEQKQELACADAILFIGDLMHYFLTGRKCVEYTVASISQLINPYTQHWEPEIFQALNIPESITGSIVCAGERIGTLRQELTDQTGIHSAEVMAPCVHDTASAVVAVPAKEGEHWAFLSSGTWSIMGVELNHPVINETSYRYNISNSGGAFQTTLCLKNVMGLWILQSCKRIWCRENPDLSYEEIAEMALQTQSPGKYLDPDHSRFLESENMVFEIVDYLLQTDQGTVNPGDIGTISRIILESLALKYRKVLKQLEEVTEEKIDVLYIVGGGVKNHLLNQLTANMLEIKVIAGPSEASAAGNIMMQAKGAGVVSSLAEIREIIRNSVELKIYEPEKEGAWGCVYTKVFNSLMK